MNNLNISFSAATMVGAREMNQDVFLVNNFLSVPEATEKQVFEGDFSASDELRVFAVCDGMGSYKKSGPAAHAALTVIRRLVEEYNTDLINEEIELKKWVLYALTEARAAILSFCSENNCRGTSATIVLLAMRNDEYVLANIGDSPCYLKTEKGELNELSLKHNLATLNRLKEEQKNKGKKTSWLKRLIAKKRRKNDEHSKIEDSILLYHLGDEKREILLTANVVGGKINHKDAFILCSDGVMSALGENAVSNMLSEKQSSYNFVEKSAETAGADNCTAIVIYAEEKDSVTTAGL